MRPDSNHIFVPCGQGLMLAGKKKHVDFRSVSDLCGNKPTRQMECLTDPWDICRRREDTLLFKYTWCTVKSAFDPSFSEDQWGATVRHLETRSGSSSVSLVEGNNWTLNPWIHVFPQRHGENIQSPPHPGTECRTFLLWSDMQRTTMSCRLAFYMSVWERVFAKGGPLPKQNWTVTGWSSELTRQTEHFPNLEHLFNTSIWEEANRKCLEWEWKRTTQHWHLIRITAPVVTLN